ncbi:hypothetical protein [Actimicrobium antarcticum]|uniref:Hemerythrin-like domain-containing protein n=1 Tax=Actimicrobium antarcticum TaxID=1051899 RepID=A0ABP7SNV0_9BURK
MLTAMYSLVAIRAEQKNVRSILGRLRYHIDSSRRELQATDLSLLELVMRRFFQFDAYCHARKVEVYVIPAIHCDDTAINNLLAELDAFSAAAMGILASLQEHHAEAREQGHVDHHQFFAEAEKYCETISCRLTKEDEHLFPEIGRLLTREDWFALGTQFLSDDGDKYAHRRIQPPSMPAALDVLS